MRIDTREGAPGYGLRAVLNGEDVTERCFLADDETGEVGLYLRNEGGSFYVNPDTFELAIEFLSGQVRLISTEAVAA